MSPALEPGDLVIGVSSLRRASKGDLVIIYHDGIEKIKRISYIDSLNIEVLGDNPAISTDSRQFGSVSKDVILAKVIYVFRLKRKISHG